MIFNSLIRNQKMARGFYSQHGLRPETAISGNNRAFCTLFQIIFISDYLFWPVTINHSSGKSPYCDQIHGC